ncbi:MAG: hypothetical protein ACOZNI_13510 [Myxococcota bacterium]
MKYAILSALGAAALSGCTGGGFCDTGDSACKGGGGDDGVNSNPPLIQYVQGECALGECVWTVEADADIGTVELSLVETGDTDRYETGCTGEVENAGLACGVWSEYHNNFQLVDDNNDGNGGDTKTLDLDIVSSFEDVVMNQTTIFDLDSGNISAQTTVLWSITDSSGVYSDCAVYGDYPDYFAGICENNWNR